MSNTFQYLDEYKYPTSVVLNITDDCNLKCRYCFVEQHPHYMTLDTAKNIVDMLVKNFIYREEKKYTLNPIHILFFGGEPLLAFDKIIQPTINYIKEKYYNFAFTFGVTTNGTLLTKEKIDFFKKNNFVLLLSCDGDKITQDYNRPCKNNSISSFDKLVENIPYLLENFPSVCFRSTIDQNTVDYMFDNYLFAEKMGFRSYYCMPDHRSMWTEDTIKKLELGMRKIMMYRINQYLFNIEPMYFSSLDNNYAKIICHDLIALGILPPEEKTINRCGLGTMGCAIGYDGNIYTCQEQPSKKEKNIFLIGNIQTGIDQNKHQQLLSQYMDNNKIECSDKKYCEECLLKDLCNSTSCPSTSYDLFQNFYTINYIRCKWENILFKNCMCAMKILIEHKNILFHNYLLKVSPIYKQYFSNIEI